MHIITSKSAILKELNAIQRIVEKKNALPILASLLLETKENELVITGTDLDVSLTTSLTAEVRAPGAVCVLAKKLFEVVRALPDAPITLKLDPKDHLLLTCEQAKFKLPTQPKQNFPDIPTWKAALTELSAPILQAFIERTAFAATNEESRYALNGAKFELSRESLRMVATDGHRLAFLEKKDSFNITDPVEAIIPKKTLVELGKLTDEADTTIAFAKDEHHFFFRLGHRTLTTRLLSGNFPNYEMVLPQQNHLQFTVGTGCLAAAVKRVALMADERSRAIKFDLADNQLTISAQASDIGEAGETLPIEWIHPALATGFNAEYLVDFLGIVNGEEARIELKDGVSQIQVRPTTETAYDFRYVIMPMRF